MGDEPQVMHQSYDSFVTADRCTLHHKIMEGQLELLRQKDKQLEEKIGGVELRLEKMDEKIDQVLELQMAFNKYSLWLAAGVILTLIGVIAGRALDFGWVI